MSTMINIPGRLHDASTDGVVTGANEVFDDIQNKNQETINSELIAAVGTGGSVDSRIAAAVNVEKTRAEAAEEVLDGRVNTLEEAVGTGGSVDSRISTAVSAETTRATAAEENLRTLYNNLQQSQPIPVTSLPATGEAGKIYRLVGTNSYADYMYNSSDLTTPIKMAQYDNAIDDEPTAGSDNLVKSGGVCEEVSQLGKDITDPIYDNSILRGAVITDGGFINPATGDVDLTVPNWCYTDYIEIKPNTDYGPIVFCAWYDENKTYISGVQDTNYGIHTSPANARYARFAEEIKRKESWGIAEGGVIVDGWQKKIFTKNLIKKTTVTDGGYIEPSNGQVVSNQDYCYTDFIPITALKSYGKLNLAAWYDYSKTYIDGAAQSTEGVISQAPSNAAYLRASIEISKRDNWSITENGEDDTLEGEILENKIRINELEAKEEQINEFHVGTGYDYASFSAAIVASSSSTVNTPTVYVHSGIYDLISENQAKASKGHNLIVIEKSMKIVFDPDAKLTALFPDSYEYYTGCSPIHIIGNADVTFEGMNIECSNCLYCVHDESYGNYTYTHKFINCNMKYTTQHSDGPRQCIGGGLGRFCTIIIDGGVYESDTSSWDTQRENELVISYHNGVNNNDNKSVIICENLYLKHKGRMEFYHCGHTEIMTGVYVCNCSMGADVTIPQGSGQYYFVDNMQLFAWNNVIRN